MAGCVGVDGYWYAMRRVDFSGSMRTDVSVTLEKGIKIQHPLTQPHPQPAYPFSNMDFFHLYVFHLNILLTISILF